MRKDFEIMRYKYRQVVSSIAYLPSKNKIDGHYIIGRVFLPPPYTQSLNYRGRSIDYYSLYPITLSNEKINYEKYIIVFSTLFFAILAFYAYSDDYEADLFLLNFENNVIIITLAISKNNFMVTSEGSTFKEGPSDEQEEIVRNDNYIASISFFVNKRYKSKLNLGSIGFNNSLSTNCYKGTMFTATKKATDLSCNYILPLLLTLIAYECLYSALTSILSVDATIEYSCPITIERVMVLHNFVRYDI